MKRGTLSVGNLRHDDLMREGVDIRCDRASILGNPYKSLDDSMRDDSCDSYKKHFYRMIESEGPFCEEVRRIYRLVTEGHDVHLMCWCTPKRCHCDTIKEFIDSY